MPTPAAAWIPSTAALPSLAEGEVQVWWGALDGEPWWEPLLPLLSVDEREHAARLRHRDDRLRSLAARALARVVLAACGAGRARALRFARGPHGKPRLTNSVRDLRFNLAHSGNAVLLAMASGREVGVDVEELRAGIADAVTGICSPAEAAALASLAADRREAGFFACWTRKEAYLKARGDGLAVEPDRFDVAVDPDAEPQLLATRHDPDDIKRWTLAALPSIPGHAATVAAMGSDWRPHCWRIQDLATSGAWLAVVE